MCHEYANELIFFHLYLPLCLASSRWGCIRVLGIFLALARSASTIFKARLSRAHSSPFEKQHESSPRFASALAGMIATGSAATFNFTLQDAFKVGLFAENNASFGNSESEGTVVVGGDLTTGGSP